MGLNHDFSAKYLKELVKAIDGKWKYTINQGDNELNYSDWIIPTIAVAAAGTLLTIFSACRLYY